MNIIQLLTLFVAFSLAECLLPYSLTQMNFLRADHTTSAPTTTAAPSPTKTEAAPATLEIPTTTANETAAQDTKKTIFEEHAWLDNIVQLICERVLRFIKLLIQKFIMKQDIGLADFLMTVLIA